MPVATMQELEGLDLGARVVVKSDVAGDAIWTKVSEGRMQREGYTHAISTENFIGAISSGAVDKLVDPTDPETETVIPPALLNDLLAYAASVEEPDFNDLLSRHGISRTREHASILTLTGVTNYFPPGSDIREAFEMDDDFTFTNTPIVPVHWQRTVRVSREGVGCTCEGVDDDLDQYLPSLWSDYDSQVDCAPTSTAI